MSQAILMRAAVHEIAGMSYIRDDDEHILIIKKGISYFRIFYRRSLEIFQLLINQYYVFFIEDKN